MKRIINAITATDLIFVLILCVSSLIENEPLSDAVYYLAFLLPLSVGVYYIKREKPITENPGSVYLAIDREGALYFLPLIFIAVAAIAAVSALTSAIMGMFGLQNSLTIDEPLPLAILIHALIPALLEEFLFRYVPIKLLLPYSRSAAIVIPAVYFALIHMNLFQIPYALVAGIIFALIDVRCQSVIPSIVIHFINNVISLLFMVSPSAGVTAALYLTLSALLIISIVFVIVKRRRYADIAEPLFEKSEGLTVGPAPLIILVLCLFMAISSLLL